MEAFNITQVYPDRYTAPLQTEEYFVGLVGKKDTGQAIKALRQYPVADHLKRVKPLRQ